MYAKYVLGRLSESWGDARNIKPTAVYPYVGGLVITTEGGGHVAIITAIDGDTLTVVEGNYIRDRISSRTLNRYNPVIRGFK